MAVTRFRFWLSGEEGVKGSQESGCKEPGEVGGDGGVACCRDTLLVGLKPVLVAVIGVTAGVGHAERVIPVCDTFLTAALWRRDAALSKDGVMHFIICK